MKVIGLAITIGVVSFFAQSLGPWWSGVAIAFFVSALAQLKPLEGFIAGLVGLGLMWGISAGFIDHNNESILSSRIGEMFGGIPAFGIVLITFAIGAVLGGLASLSGSLGMRWLIGK